jgi:hypothetical protein
MNIETPFLASAKATACGVLTTTTPVIGKPERSKVNISVPG